MRVTIITILIIYLLPIWDILIVREMRRNKLKNDKEKGKR
jgi:hypothetical protein